VGAVRERAERGEEAFKVLGVKGRCRGGEGESGEGGKTFKVLDTFLR